MATTVTAGGSLNSVPAPNQQTLASNYVDFTSTATAGWAQQYLPDLMEKEAEVFGNRTVGGFLEMVGAEEPMSADQVVWSEQGRLHLSYQGNIQRSSPATTFTFAIVKDVDGNAMTGATSAAAQANVGVRVGDLVLLTDANESVKGYVTAISGAQAGSPAAGVFMATISVTPLTDDGTGLTNVTLSNSDVTGGLMVFGSEYGKGSSGRTLSNSPVFKSFTNQPVILKDMYEVSGSDAAQIGWVEVSGEDGQAGYLWYLKAAGDTRMRFADYCEMTLLEHEIVTETTGGFSGHSAGSAAGSQNTAAGTIKGTEGLFAAITTRGNKYDGLTSAATAAQALDDFDEVLKEFDKQGAIEEYMLFGNRDMMLTVDDMLAGMNSYGSGGTSYGVFDNSEDMALNLGFSGFRRGSYDFYKTDWKYLNDQSTRGGIKDSTNSIRGVFIPAGVTSVYDQTLGKNLKRPFLHVRYRASQMEDRRFKTWTTGSVGAATSDLDAMHMHFLSERCLVTQGANNFMLVTGVGTY